MDIRDVLEIEKSVTEDGIITLSKEIGSACYLKVTVGTTGRQGGDAGYGCRVYFSIENEGGASIDANVYKDSYDGFKKLELRLGGDCELDCIIEAFGFAVEALKGMDEIYAYREGK